MLTVDTFLPGWKPRDLQGAWQPFFDGTGIANYVSDPVFQSMLDKPPDEDPQAAVASSSCSSRTPSSTGTTSSSSGRRRSCRC